MKQRRTHKEISNDKKDHYGGLAEAQPDEKASKKFRDPPYQAGKMIRVQGNQMQHKSVEEYIAERYDISGGDEFGQDKVKAVQSTCERGAKA